MERGEFVTMLKKVSAALSGKDLIPIFSCFCFTRDGVYAYDDIVALQLPMKTPILGGVKGSLLLNWLGASKAKELEIEQKGESLMIKAGRAKLETPVLPDSLFIFKPVDPAKAQEIPVDAKFTDALAKASISLGRDPSHSWRLGVTVVFGENGTLLYACDDKTVARVFVGKSFKPTGDEVTTILPPRFVQLMMDLAKTDPVKKLLLAKKWAEVRFASGLRLFSRTIQDVQVDAFSGMFDELPKNYLELPRGLAPALQRAQVVLGKHPYTKFSVSEDRIRLTTESQMGNANDAVGIEGEHETLEAEFPPDLVLRGLPFAEKFRILRDRCVLSGPGFTYQVSAVSHEDEKGAQEEPPSEEYAPEE